MDASSSSPKPAIKPEVALQLPTLLIYLHFIGLRPSSQRGSAPGPLGLSPRLFLDRTLCPLPFSMAVLVTGVLGHRPDSQGSTCPSPIALSKEMKNGERRIRQDAGSLGRGRGKHFSHLQGTGMNFRFK
jgi:hypothetical protein